MVISVHKDQGEIFDRDQVILEDDPIAELVKKIPPLIPDPLVQPGYPAVGALLALASLDLPGSVALQSP